jgi:hypothetical protein
MSENLGREALDLCSVLYREILREKEARNEYGISLTDYDRLRRLERLWCRAADRWRRREGMPPRYKSFLQRFGGCLMSADDLRQQGAIWILFDPSGSKVVGAAFESASIAHMVSLVSGLVTWYSVGDNRYVQVATKEDQGVVS